MEPYSQKLTITVTIPSEENAADLNITFSAEMADCNVHAWFDAFGKTLAAVGFQESVIMSGACRLAFNEYRPIELMRSVAHEYDLTLAEDLEADPPSLKLVSSPDFNSQDLRPISDT